MLLFSALLALSIHLNVSHPEVIIYSQLTSSCHATTTTTTTLILFPPTLTFLFFAPFFQCFSISGSIAVDAAAADTTINNVCRLQLHHHHRSELGTVEVLFLAWGVRLCIMVRKAPSEFNESRFISMAIYNEFLLTCFLNVSM